MSTLWQMRLQMWNHWSACSCVIWVYLAFNWTGISCIYQFAQQLTSRFVWIAGTGLAAFFINIAVENFSGWKFAATFAVMKYSYFLGLLIYILFNAALVFSSVYIITQFAPAAAGSGIPEIKAYLNGMLQCNHCFYIFKHLWEYWW